MEQYGILEVANNLGEFNNSTVKDARDNLLLGDLCIQDNQNVTLSGNIHVDSFKFLSSNASTMGQILTSGTEYGDLQWADFNLPQWVSTSEQKYIELGKFSNDLNLIKYDSIIGNDFARFGSFRYLKNRPDFKSVKEHYGYTGTFTTAASNLEQYENKSECRRNLGLGDLATYSSEYVSMKNVQISDSMEIQNFFQSDRTFTLLSNNNETGVHAYGIDLPLITNQLTSEYHKLPSSLLLSNVFSEITDLITSTSYSNDDFLEQNSNHIQNLLAADVLLTKCNLNFTDDQAAAARQNLGIGNISLQNSNEVVVNHTHVKNSFTNVEGSGKVYFNNEWIPSCNLKYTALADEKNAGFVSIDGVLSYNLALNTSNELHSNLVVTREHINHILDEYSKDLLNVSKNLSNIPDAEKARSNLELHSVAHSGKLSDLEDRPSFLSELENDANYLSKNNNLGDIPLSLQELALQNIGVSNMAFEDADNIGGTETVPLGIGNRKFHSTDTIIDVAYVEKDKFFLRTLDPLSEIESDFLCVEKYNVDVPGTINYQYRYKDIPKLDEVYYRGPFLTNPDENVRVRLNDLSSPELNIVQDTDGTPLRNDYVIAENLIPTCEFASNKFASITSNILQTFDIPFEYYEGGFENIL